MLIDNKDILIESFVAKKAAKSAAKKAAKRAAKKAAKKAAKTAASAASAAKRGSKKAASAVKRGARKGAKKVSKFAKKVSDKAKKVAKKVGDSVRKVSKKVSDGAKKVAKKVKSGVKKAGKTLKKAAGKAKRVIKKNKKLVAAAALAGMSVAAYVAFLEMKKKEMEDSGTSLPPDLDELLDESKEDTVEKTDTEEKDNICKKDEFGNYPDENCDSDGNYVGKKVLGSTYPKDKPFFDVLSDFFGEFTKNPKKALLKLWNYLKANKMIMFIVLGIIVLFFLWLIL